MVRGVLSQLKNLEEENRDLKDQVQLLGGKMSKLEDANLALQDNSFVLKSDLQMARGDMRRLSTSQDVLRAAFAEPPRTLIVAHLSQSEGKM